MASCAERATKSVHIVNSILLVFPAVIIGLLFSPVPTQDPRFRKR